MTLEEQAIALGNDRKALYKRLRQAVACMNTFYQKKFAVAKCTFDFANKRLVLKDKTMVAQWTVRAEPDKPESYENQQTSQGSVGVIRNDFPHLGNNFPKLG